MKSAWPLGTRDPRGWGCSLDTRALTREFKMNDLTRTIPAWNLPVRVTMNDFSCEKKFLLNSSKEWRMRMRGFWVPTCYFLSRRLWLAKWISSRNFWGLGLILPTLQTVIFYGQIVPLCSSIDVSYLTFYLTIFLSALAGESRLGSKISAS